MLLGNMNSLLIPNYVFQNKNLSCTDIVVCAAIYRSAQILNTTEVQICFHDLASHLQRSLPSIQAALKVLFRENLIGRAFRPEGLYVRCYPQYESISEPLIPRPRVYYAVSEYRLKELIAIFAPQAHPYCARCSGIGLRCADDPNSWKYGDLIECECTFNTCGEI